MNLKKFFTYFTFSNKQKSQLKVNLNSSLVTLWKYIQNSTCKFVYIINQLYQLIWASYYALIANIKGTNEVTDWQKVGEVTNLYTYPLLGGSKEEVSKCSLTHTSMIGMDSKLRNHMFVVYDSITRCVIYDYNNYRMRNIKILNLGSNKLILKSYTMSLHHMITLDINEVTASEHSAIKCTTSFCKQFLTYINCIDCGSKAAKWISKCLNDRTWTLRLGYTVPQITQTPFSKHIQQICRKTKDKRNITVSSSYLPICTLAPSLLHGNNKLATSESRRYEQEVQANIVISTNSLYDSIEWEWIKIGNVTLKNLKPWRSSQTNLDGQNMPVSMILNLLPWHGELYHSGQVQIGDEVQAKMPLNR